MWRLSPLHHAALSGNKEMISLLLEAQAAVDIKDHKGKKKNAHRLSQCHWDTLCCHKIRHKTHTRIHTAVQKKPKNKYFPAFPVWQIIPAYVIKGELVGNAVFVCGVHLWGATDLFAQSTIENRRRKAPRLQEWEPSGKQSREYLDPTLADSRRRRRRRRNLRADGSYNPSRM